MISMWPAKKIMTPIAISLLMTLIVFGIHMSPAINSLLNNFDTTLDVNNLNEIIAYHQTEPTFAKRIFTTQPVLFLSNLFEIEKGLAFVIFNFTLIALNGFLVYLLSNKILRSKKAGIINMLVFYACFSNLFPFFEPIYTYDEPIQFAFLWLSILYLIGEKLWLFSLLFFLSLCARESSLILLPGLVLLWRHLNSNQNKAQIYQTVFWFGLPIVLYIVYRLTIEQNHISESEINGSFMDRLQAIRNNFQSWTTGFEAVFSFFLIFAWPLYWLQRIRKYHIRIFVKYLGWIQAFYLTLILNTIVVYFFTNAGEVRLFVLPLFLLWPVFYQFFKTEFKSLRSIKSLFKSPLAIGVLTLLTIINYVISIEVYKTTISFPNYNYFNEYSFLLFLFLAIHFSISIALKIEQKRNII